MTAGRVLINARVTRRATITGVERWAAELIPRLLAFEADRYALARPPAQASSGALGQMWEQALLPAQAALSRASVIFSPANLAPLVWPRNVVMVHDAAPFRRPDAYERAYRLWHQRLGVACARRALQVVTVSEFSRRELVELLSLNPKAVTVVRGGVSERFSPDADDERVREKLGLPHPYVLTVGTNDERKNFAVLNVAAQRLREGGVELVRAGDTRPHFSQTSAVDGVRSIGYVAEEDLPGLYRGASAFVLPSLYEGLGLPCLEAMASGVPVVASNRAALPETCGDAAILVEPDDRDAIATALERAIADDTLRARLRAAGLRRAAEQSWDRAAREVHSLLSRLAGSGRPGPTAGGAASADYPGIRPSP